MHDGVIDAKTEVYGGNNPQTNYERFRWERCSSIFVPLQRAAPMVDRGGVDPLLFGQGPGPGGDGMRPLVNQLLTAVAVLTAKLTIMESAVEELGAMAAHLDFLEGEHEALRCSIEQLRAKTAELDRRSQRG